MSGEVLFTHDRKDEWPKSPIDFYQKSCLSSSVQKAHKFTTKKKGFWTTRIVFSEKALYHSPSET